MLPFVVVAVNCITVDIATPVTGFPTVPLVAAIDSVIVPAPLLYAVTNVLPTIPFPYTGIPTIIAPDVTTTEDTVVVPLRVPVNVLVDTMVPVPAFMLPEIETSVALPVTVFDSVAVFVGAAEYEVTIVLAGMPVPVTVIPTRLSLIHI